MTADVGQIGALDALLVADRVTGYRFEVLDNDENERGMLTSVEPGGSITWDATASVKAGGSIDVTDVGDDIDWLNVRIRPVVVVSSERGTAEFPVGVYLASAPVEKWTALGRVWSVELLDKNSVLDQDVWADPVSGLPATFTAKAGDNVADLVRLVIEGAGESAAGIPASSTATVPAALTWDVGTTRLKIINDLLEASNHLALWPDRYGVYRMVPYQPPAQRSPVYADLAPLSYGDTSLMDPEWQHDRDSYAVPNRFMAVSQGSGTTAPWVSVATNEDSDSPYSYPARGRWITETEEGVEVVSQEALDVYARRRLDEITARTSVLTVAHAFLPDLAIHETVRFQNPALEGLYVVTSTSVVFEPTDLSKTTLVEAR
jgi:hypothetical protein